MNEYKNHFKPEKEVDGVKVFKVYGSYTVETTKDYYKLCDNVIEGDSIKAILLDFEDAEEIDTAGFACIINFIKEQVNNGKRIGVVNLDRKSQDLLEILRIQGVISLFSDETEAIENLSK